MYNESINTKEKRKVILPTNDLNFKRLFASPHLIHISKGFLQDIAVYDPLGLLQISSLSIETPYNFQDVNQLIAEHGEEILSTEVDYACRDQKAARFILEMQKRDQCYLEERIVYNVGQKFAQFYASDQGHFTSKYASLKPVIAVILLEDNHFKDDVAIRFLRPYDPRHHVYKNNPNLGLEIYVEINKDTSKLPRNLQLWMEYFKTGSVSEGAPHYLQEAAKMVEISSFTKAERELVDRLDHARQRRLAEDEATGIKASTEGIMQERERASAEKIEMVKSLINNGVSIDVIMNSTGFSEVEILQLKCE